MPVRAGRIPLRAARVLFVLCILGIFGPAPSTFAEPIDIKATAVSLYTDERREDRLGVLKYAGGLDLRTSDARFGGWSALWVSDNGDRLIAISDKGEWLTASLTYDEFGMLAGLERADIVPIADSSGRPLETKRRKDAESLVPDGPDAMLVSFEHDHRIVRYSVSPWPPGPAQPVAGPRDLKNSPNNRGIESLARLPDGRVFALTEAFRLPGERVMGWIGDDQGWITFGYPAHEFFRPTGAAMMGNQLLILERGFSLLRGVGVRLMMLDPNHLPPGNHRQVTEVARLISPVRVDNFEGLATRKGDDGQWRVYLLSDDNFNPLQRTLLLMFTVQATP